MNNNLRPNFLVSISISLRKFRVVFPELLIRESCRGAWQNTVFANYGFCAVDKL